ncbi:glucose 1-dehydrogenase [Pseudonocardia halophobica]|uniref:Dehydrogenase n=1 Tax=Pseudonocardia halophobica TaxID=29401 RepID=A0A9W6UFM7_9PSEU|nr:SDR family oxidoreductase [Pseudonocardia halophobica]GLL15532.1 dehydrogenase [Pseudonocardia halophobica]
MNRLEGRTAVVTGTSPNIGGAIALGLAAEGAQVTCTDIDPDTAEACAAKIVANGGEAIAVAGDVTDPAHAEDVVARTAERWGGVDVLVNNAVQFNHKGLLEMPIEEFRRQTDIILSGAFLFTRAVARDLIAREAPGSIVNILSTAAWQGQPGNIGYCTAKSGLINFTRSVAMELAAHRIRVNGFTPTATLREGPPPPGPAPAAQGFRMDFRGLHPSGRLPTAADYVPAVVFLASDDAAMITGSNITVDGGATAKYWPWAPGTDGGGTP